MQPQLTPDIIGKFLEGSDPTQFIVAAEANYYESIVTLIVNDPVRGKLKIRDTLKPFIWMKDSALDYLFKGDRKMLKNKMREAKIKVKLLTTAREDGYEPDRLKNGFKYLVSGEGNYNQLIAFFKDAGLDIFKIGEKEHFFALTPVEQYLIQSGKRLFKGIDNYDSLHRFQFDLETTGLDPTQSRIFKIGMKDNRGFEHILKVEEGENMLQKELDAISTFFQVIDELKPDIIAGYNSENFDWFFIFTRCELLSRREDYIKKIAIPLDKKQSIRRQNSQLKLGADVEYYKQTLLWGYNIIDIWHSVRRAQAINSDIKEAGLKYITKFSEIAKPNRVYVKPDKIYPTESNKDGLYALNDTDGDWYQITDNTPLKESYDAVTGEYIIDRYLQDDLWETEQIDNIFNQASFLLAKILPTTYQRVVTIGQAAIWRLIMSAWSYTNGLAIPEYHPRRDFAGGLSRLIRVGRATNVYKLDYAALYPNTSLTWDISTDFDITGAMLGFLLYIAENRDEFKGLKNKYDKEGDSKLSGFYDRKQLPLKILANAYFGAISAPYLFPWGDVDCGEEITCRGRIYFRMMIKYFKERFDFEPLTGDSVTHDSPIYIKYENGEIDILPICDIFDENGCDVEDKYRDYSKKKFKVLTRSGYKDIKYVYKHETTKKIHNITTKDRYIKVTEDHSLFSGKKEIKPTGLKRGDLIDTQEIQLTTINNEINEDLAWVLGFFVGDGSSVFKYRTQNYYSIKKKEIIKHDSYRSEVTFHNQDLVLLDKTDKICLKELGVQFILKDYRKSSAVYKLRTHNVKLAKWFSSIAYTSYREKKIPVCILNAGLNIKEAFLNGLFAADGWGTNIDEIKNITQKSQIVMAGVYIMLHDLGKNFRVKIRKDKENMIAFDFGETSPINDDNSDKRTFEVWGNRIVKPLNKYVYDISTEDGTFITGIGGFVAHNTDGIDFEVPECVNDYKYISNGNHRFTEKDKEYSGVDAAVAEYNDLYMIGRMGLDVDDKYESTLKLSRKNYANKVIKKGKTKIKLVGNSIKSKKMPGYIEDFLDKAIELLLDGKAIEFMNAYYEYVDEIYNYRIPLVKIASRAKVKISLKEYHAKSRKKNKKGNPLPKQAHMELAIQNNMAINLGDVIYYVNTGKKKADGDIKTDKKTGVTSINCMLIPTDQIENNPNLTTQEYNVPKYLEALNAKLEPLLVVFHPDIRDSILLHIKTDKKTKVSVLEERKYFTPAQCEMVSGIPYKPEDQDDYDRDVMAFEDKELRFWCSTDKQPNNLIDLGITDGAWEEMKADYKDRMIKNRAVDLIKEHEMFEDITMHLEIDDLNKISDGITNDYEATVEYLHELYKFLLIDVTDAGVNLISKKYGNVISPLGSVLQYMDVAEERAKFYETLSEDEMEHGYDLWLTAHPVAESTVIEEIKEDAYPATTDENTVDLASDNEPSAGSINIEVKQEDAQYCSLRQTGYISEDGRVDVDEDSGKLEKIDNNIPEEESVKSAPEENDDKWNF